MVTVARLLLLRLLLLVRQAAVAAGQAHHERLGVVEGGGLVVQAVGADGSFHHVELLQLSITEEENCCCGAERCVTAGTHRGLLSDLLRQSAGLDGWELLVVEVCKHAAQYGVVLKQRGPVCQRSLINKVSRRTSIMFIGPAAKHLARNVAQSKQSKQQQEQQRLQSGNGTLPPLGSSFPCVPKLTDRRVALRSSQQLHTFLNII